MTPKISVIVAVYNVEPYLRRSMDCLMNQTIQNLEFICIDDCSTDGSLEILREYEAKDNRFKIIHLKENLGAATARNKGLDIAKGEYLGFIDPDDTIDLNYYEELYKIAEKTNADIVKCAIKDVYKDGTTIKSRANNAIRMNKYNFVNEWTTAIYKTKFIRDNNIRFPDECTKAQDIVFLNRTVLKAKDIECIDNVFYYYYKRDNSLNALKIPLKSIQSACKARELMAQDLNDTEIFVKNRKQYDKMYYNIAKTVFFTLFQNNSKEARGACAQNIINLYNLCLNKRSFEKRFSYPGLMSIIKKQNIKTLAEILFSIKTRDDLENKYCKLIKKICSARSSYDKTHKIITILGIRFRFKRV